MAIRINLTEDDLKKSKRPELPSISEALLEVHIKSPGIHPKSDLDKIQPDAETPKPATYQELKENFKNSANWKAAWAKISIPACISILKTWKR